MAPFAQSLNSSDVFVLHDPHACFIWVGKGSIGDEKECAKEVLGRISKSDDADLIMEGKEPETFWQLLGGKADYGSAKQIWVSKLPLLNKTFRYKRGSPSFISHLCGREMQI